jgi:ubiquinone/menaquinone biosynthesis C-methylase UbiE
MTTKKEEIRLNLGCGNDHKEGFVNIDKNSICNPDIVCDLGSEQLPFDDNSVSFVYGYQLLEHLYDHELIFLFNELKRVCRDGCKMHFVSPYMFSPVMGLIEHRKMLSEQTFRMMGGWLDVSYDIKFGVIWYRLKKCIPLPYLLPTSIHFDLIVKKTKEE